MIRLHRLNGSEFVVNADLIETLEATPDTIITLITNKKLLVAESVDQVLERILEFRRQAGFRLVPRDQLEE